MKILKHLFVSLFLVLSSIGIMTNTQGYVVAQSELACQGLEDVSGGGTCGTASGDPTVNGVIEFALNLLSFIAGFIAVVMIIIAGLRFITSQGDPSSANGARSALIYAIIGIVIVVLAQVIVQFVLNRATVIPDPAEEDSTMITEKIIAQGQIFYRV